MLGRRRRRRRLGDYSGMFSLSHSNAGLAQAVEEWAAHREAREQALDGKVLSEEK